MEVEDVTSSPTTSTTPAATAAAPAVQPKDNDNVRATNNNSKDDDDSFVTRPGPHDVLMGRGAPMSEHEGNARLRTIVLARHVDYVDPARQRPAKHAVAVEIVQAVRANGGRFLRKTDTNDWLVVQDEKEIIRKVKQLLRDMGPEARQKRAERHLQRGKHATAAVKANAVDESSSSETVPEQAILMPRAPAAAAALPSLLARQRANAAATTQPTPSLSMMRPLSLRQAIALPQVMQAATSSMEQQQQTSTLPLGIGGSSLPTATAVLQASSFPGPLTSWQLGLEQLRAAPATTSATTSLLDASQTRRRLFEAMQQQLERASASSQHADYQSLLFGRSASSGLLPSDSSSASLLSASQQSSSSLLPSSSAPLLSSVSPLRHHHSDSSLESSLLLSEALAQQNLQARLLGLRSNAGLSSSLASTSTSARSSSSTSSNPSLSLLARRGLLQHQQQQQQQQQRQALEDLLLQQQQHSRDAALADLIRSLQESNLRRSHSDSFSGLPR